MHKQTIMTTSYDLLKDRLRLQPKVWLITGVAGFIGSNLLETLLALDQHVVGIDNFSTGYQHNLDHVKGLVTDTQWERFSFFQGDICNIQDCRTVCANVDYVLHQAAIGSVPRSIDDPVSTNAANISGFLNMLVSAKEADVKSFTYAASSSTYGDHPGLPKIEEFIGAPLSPYAVTKYVNELYASVFARCYGFKSIGLRYFNIFGRRQDPDGAYAAVIPKWIAAMINGDVVYINGDGETSRDFCYVENAIQANLLAATTDHEGAKDQIYNIAVGGRTTLNGLFSAIKENLAENGICYSSNLIHRDFRPGDVRHSQADIGKAQKLLGYVPQFDINQGIRDCLPWYIKQLRK